MRISIYIIAYISITFLICCRNKSTQCCLPEELDIIKFLYKQGKVCLDSDTIFVFNNIVKKINDEYVSESQFIRKNWKIDNFATVVFIEKGFLNYPRKYNCVNSFTLSYQNQYQVLVDFWYFLDLKKDFYPGKDEAEQPQRNFLIQINKEDEWRIIDEDVGLKIETE